MEGSPWVEKYRPTSFENIVLNASNKRVIENIISKKHFPHLILYGPPGTGKTTTAINLIDEFQRQTGEKDSEKVIHLNASDERGIEVIRSCIQQFVVSKGIFKEGLKFIILDEVDYMTKNAQLALKFLIQEANPNIRFCLICNYISKVHYSLQNEFVKLCFNYLPCEHITRFLGHICEQENISFTKEQLQSLHTIYKSDIRSMINHIQSNHEATATLMNESTFETMLDVIKQIKIRPSKKQLSGVCQKIEHIAHSHNMGSLGAIKKLLNYIITSKFDKKEKAVPLMTLVKFIVHNPGAKEGYIVSYSVLRLSSLGI
jgi:replication factor C subunit 3/5